MKPILFAAACALTFAAADAGQARTPSVSARDRAAAAQQHPQVVAQFGGEVTGPASTYVKAVGEKMASTAGLPGQCTFTLIGSEVVNAFAVPGCYIYVTRGLLAIMNSEDELASVLGHEVGHITGNHSGQRQTRGALAGLGALAVGVITGSGQLAQVASQLGGLYTLSYSRAQEFDADDRGVSFLLGSGYNSFAAADMLQTLGSNDALTRRVGQRTGSEIPAWASSHPLTGDRVTRAAAKAQASGGVRETPAQKSRVYLQAVNGLIYGDDPEQGFVNGNTFAHPKLKIAFDVPQGFTLTNTATSVNVAGPNGLKAMFSAGALSSGGLDAYATGVLAKVVGQAPTQVAAFQHGTTNGLQTTLLPARAQTSSGQQVDVAVTAYQVGNSAYHFVTLAPAGAAGPFTPMLGSFRQLSDQQAAALRARRIEVVTVGAGDTVQSLAQRMAFTDYQVDRFLSLNGRTATQPLRAGELVKLITYAR